MRVVEERKSSGLEDDVLEGWGTHSGSEEKEYLNENFMEIYDHFPITLKDMYMPENALRQLRVYKQ